MAELTENTPISSLLPDYNKPQRVFLPDLLQVLDYSDDNFSMGSRTRMDWRDLLAVFNRWNIFKEPYQTDDIRDEAMVDEMTSYALCLLDTWAREKGNKATVGVLVSAMDEAGIDTTCLRMHLPPTPQAKVTTGVQESGKTEDQAPKENSKATEETALEEALLSYRIFFLKLSQEIADQWHTLGTHLNVSYRVLEMVDKDAGDTIDKAYACLRKWKEESTTEPHVEEICRALEKMNCQGIMRKVVWEHYPRLRQGAAVMHDVTHQDRRRGGGRTQVTDDNSEELFEIVTKEIGGRWKNLARYLPGLDDTDVDGIAQKTDRNSEQKCEACLHKWLGAKLSSDPLVEHLMWVLEQMKMNSLVRKIQQDFRDEGVTIGDPINPYQE